MEQIKAGDLVMVVRWLHKCLSKTYPVGKPFIAGRVNYDHAACPYCDEFTYGRHVSTPEGAAIPAAWLKKIDPLSDPEEAQTKVEREIKKRSPVKA